MIYWTLDNLKALHYIQSQEVVAMSRSYRIHLWNSHQNEYRRKELDRFEELETTELIEEAEIELSEEGKEENNESV